jgi:hypothetical protein
LREWSELVMAKGVSPATAADRALLKAPHLLLDMRRVYRMEKERDRTPQQRRLREFLEKDPQGYLKQMNLLEVQFEQRRTEQLRGLNEKKLVEKSGDKINDTIRRLIRNAGGQDVDGGELVEECAEGVFGQSDLPAKYHSARGKLEDGQGRVEEGVP